MNKGEKSSYRPVRISPGLDDTLGRLAAEQHRSKSEVLRELVEEGLKATGATVDESHLYEVIRKAVAEELSPSVERLAAISAKATQIASASFFMAIWAAARDGSEEDQAAIQEAAESSRRLGIEYLKLKDRNIDAFIKEGANQVLGKSEEKR